MSLKKNVWFLTFLFVFFFEIFNVLTVYGQDSEDVEIIDSDETSAIELDEETKRNFKSGEGEYYQKLNKAGVFSLDGKKPLEQRPSQNFKIKGDSELKDLIDDVKKKRQGPSHAQKNHNDSKFKAQGHDLSEGQNLGMNRGPHLKINERVALLQQLDVKDLVGPEGPKKLKVALEPLGRIDQTILVENFRKSFTQGGSIGQSLAQSESFLHFLASMLQSPEALPGLLKIFIDKEKLMIYGIISLLILLFGLLLGRFKKKFKFFSLKRFLFFIFRLTLILTMTFVVFVAFFSKEISPTLQLIQKHFLS